MSAHVMSDSGWVHTRSAHEECRDNCRPVVVIDPDDGGQVKALTSAYVTEYDGIESRAQEGEVRSMQAALRSLANPTPPKPEEPLGRGAVVATDKGMEWVRVHPGGQAWVNGYGRWCAWSDIAAVKVLSEGVTP